MATKTSPDTTAGAGAETGAGPKTAVVIPCFREKDRIADVLAAVGPEVSLIVVVDDACPDGTGRFVQDTVHDPRVDVIIHAANTGVGGATKTGYRRAVEAGCDVIVKLDGDGQMDPALIPSFVRPIAEGRADYVKGNRFHDLSGVGAMPAARLIGNIGLSFLTKASSGYWSVFDPTNGFTAIHARVARDLPLDAVDDGFFFESDMLFRLGLMRALVHQVPMRARYGDETSSLSVMRAGPEFLWKNLRNTARRLFYRYVLHDVSAASIELVLGTAALAFGVVFGLSAWAESMRSGVPATAGTVILAALPVIVGVQMLLAFLNHDTQAMPRTPIHPDLAPLKRDESA
jgi:dolichol-phosphate mannosyltransferase